MPIEATVCLLRKDGSLLLQKKASERFGGGKWDGPGGKLRPGESPAEGVVREVEEETGLTIIAPTFHGSFDVYFGPGDQPAWIVVYRDRHHKVGFIELNAVAARLLELIQADTGVSGRRLLEQIAAELAHPDPDTVITGGLEIMQNLYRKDILQGALSP